MISSDKFCLIGGTGRSGTTILSRIFAAHPEMSDSREWRFAIDPDGILDFYTSLTGVWSPYLYDVKLKRLESLLKSVSSDPIHEKLWMAIQRTIPVMLHRKLTPRYSGIQAGNICPQFDRHVKQLMNDLTEFRFEGSWVGTSFLDTTELTYGCPNQEKLAEILGNFLCVVAGDVIQTQGVNHYLEKNTWNILFLDKILELVPDAKMVHIYRDPRDVVSSFMQQRWMPSSAIQSAMIYRNLIERWWDVRSKVPQGLYMELSLESLVSEPEQNLREICDFWGVTWDDSLLQLDLSRSHAGRWKKDIPEGELSEVEEILKDQIVAFGYE